MSAQLEIRGMKLRLNLAQAFNSLGTTIGPYFGSLVILSATPEND